MRIASLVAAQRLAVPPLTLAVGVAGIFGYHFLLPERIQGGAGR